MRISKEHQNIIEDLLQKQNQNAMTMGIVEIEMEAAIDKIKAEGNDPVRRGALLVEREDRREFFLQAVRRARAEQKQAGECALRACGIEPDKGEFRIYNGEIMQLIAGRWVMHETAQQFIPPEERGT